MLEDAISLLSKINRQGSFEESLNTFAKCSRPAESSTIA
jgi:hypothetical protein